MWEGRVFAAFSMAFLVPGMFGLASIASKL